MRILGAALPMILLAGCVSPAPPPRAAAPVPPRPIAPAPPPPPAPAPVAADWRDIPLTPGNWAYLPDVRGSSAMFGRPGLEADFIVRCDLASRTISLSWPVAVGTTATITTSFGAQEFAPTAIGGTAPRMGTTMPASSAFLDRLAFSRGRFMVTGAGGARLVIPAWPEAARAIEDCRK